MLAGGEVTADPAAAKMVPPTLPLMNWLVPSAPANQGGFPSNDAKRSSLFPHRNTCQSVAKTTDRNATTHRCGAARDDASKNLPEPAHREVLSLRTYERFLPATGILLMRLSESVFHVA